jgi:predicted nucleic acid-binding Zn ribbon protein
MPDRSRSKRPRPLAGAVARLRAELAPPTLLAKVQQKWGDAVGADVEREAMPVSERGGVVTVSCRSATWSSELTMLSGQLLERLNESLDGDARVSELRFTTDPR